MTFLRKTLSLTVLLAMACMVRAVETGSVPPKPNKLDITSASKPADLQRLMRDFNARRETILSDREALISQLKTATEEQRNAILAKMQAQQKELVDAQRALGKQIRDEMRKLKLNSAGKRN